ncbi:MAG: DISARM system helicase DrmA [Prochloraceae cyanobacterium]|nr:DISARM system helicase DrmA [Prochloraceae cyanobacterium]
MEIIKLPPVLPGDLDLAEINQQLKDGKAELDWSEVVSAQQKYLEVLLAELDLSDNADVLGIDGTIADNIASEIILFCESRRSKKSKSRSKKRSESQFTPQVWEQASVKNEGEKIEEERKDEGENLKEEREKNSSFIPDPSSLKILDRATTYTIRAELETAILKDLLGPVGGSEEEIEEKSITDRYLVGLLAPRLRRKKNEQQEDEVPLEEESELQESLEIVGQDSPEEGSTEASVPPPNTMFPSSMGMTFCVSGEADKIAITAKWGKYQREKSQISFKDDGSPKQVWKRYPQEGRTTEALVEGREIHWVVSPQEEPDVYVKGKIRRLDNGEWIVSLFLVNAQQEPNKLRDRAWLFQPELFVTSPDSSNQDIFLRKPLPVSIKNLDPLIHQENQAMAMLYRHQVEFAVGHGVSVRAETTENNTKRAVCLATSFVPTYEVAKTTPPTEAEIPELTGLVLDMQKLSQAEAKELPTYLNPLVTAYSSWIEQQQQRIDAPQSGFLRDRAEELTEYEDVAKNAIANCQQTLERIQAGITVLQNNPQAVEAFQFMNNAMWKQRIHSIYAEKKRRGEKLKLEDIDLPKNRSWYPFQLAFILLNLPSVTDIHHQDRSDPTKAIADLLWFPTGGGKTEAYLGLSAYTIGLRRLQGKLGGRDGNYGVAVLMRYTLRLLTLQQFQRATALICACEAIRRQDESKWGREPFRIGLWVGQNSTPNYTSQSEECIKQLRSQSRQIKGGTPHQLTNCPWCGSKIDPGKNITVEPVDKGRGRTYIKCGDVLGRCIFSKGEGLPVLVVDEEIYRRLPTLLIATVDKFAQMPWKGQVQMLFGQVSGYCERHGFRSPDVEDKERHNKTGSLPAAKTIPSSKLRPPDLIIQDELHLISGPLGTLVGLYETVVDKLASWEVNGKLVRPKVIASTATIRQAQTQVHNIFLRQLQIFPPQGLDIQDNFFSRQRQPSEATPGRRYLGICAPGRRLKATIIRVYLAVLSASQALYEKYGKKADPWMTLVGYFNSLRELGGTRRLVEDDIRNRLAKMEKRGLAKRYIRMGGMEELTSRKDSTEIPVILDRLEIPFDPETEAENRSRRKADRQVDKPDPLDVILATNMISVGVDVKRLGVMVACGQPKNTAEYIQATSRVGRTHPGLVITVYNWARPRDLSHYERFAHYHATFYQHVEALSVTPFASGALDRGLTALLISLIRQAGEEFNGNDRAGKIERNHPYVRAALDAIVDRAEQIEGNQAGDRLRRELSVKLDKWLRRVAQLESGTTLQYQTSSRDGTAIKLIEAAGKGQWDDFTCLNSLRNVEPTVGLVLTDSPPDEDNSRLPQPYSQKG